MQIEFLRRAIDLAIDNVRDGRGGPFAALIVRDGAVVAAGANRVTSANDPTAHAEVVAIRGACRALGTFKLTGCEIYTNSEPCPMCLGAIYWARIERIYFAANAEDAAAAGFDDSWIYAEVRKAPEHRRIPSQTGLREEALEAFRTWREKRNHVSY